MTAGLTLNKEKYLFSKRTITFLGHVIDSSGVSSDPEKIAAIKDMPPPENISDLRRFMGMVTQLGKFAPNLAELSQPYESYLVQSGAGVGDLTKLNRLQISKQNDQTSCTCILQSCKRDQSVSGCLFAWSRSGPSTDGSQCMEASSVCFSFYMSSTEVRYAQIEKEAPCGHMGM